MRYLAKSALPEPAARRESQKGYECSTLVLRRWAWEKKPVCLHAHGALPAMGISRDSQHKRRLTGGKKPHHHKKRKHEMGRQMAMTKIGAKRIHPVRCRGGNMKFRGIRLDTGNFSWGSEVCTRKTRILDVVYNASNNELVRTKTLVKSAVVQIDATCGRPRPLPHAPHAPPRYHRAQWRRGEAWSAGWQRGSRRAERSAGARVDQGQMDVGRGRWGGDLLPPNPGSLRRCLRADPTKGGGRGGAQSWAGLWERSAGEMPGESREATGWRTAPSPCVRSPHPPPALAQAVPAVVRGALWRDARQEAEGQGGG